jgi:queuine tRNA-ribosyltransferase
MTFRLEAGGATAPRAGLLMLAHGTVPTPAFMPVATHGTVKALDMADVRELGVDMLLVNAYHLWRAPGADVVAAAGGLHRYTRWERPILTDSGGFQVVSLARAGKARVDEQGVTFAEGQGQALLTPELAMEVQERLAPDVMMTLDQPLSFPAPAQDAVAATERTHRWAARCLAARSRAGPELWGIVQGGFDPELRRDSASAIRALGFPGYGIGGLSLDEPPELMRELLGVVNAELEPDKPRYLMGVGSEPELLDAIAAGCDLFDCVWPTRLARTATALVGPGRVNLLKAAFAEASGPLEEGCDCPTCRGHQRAQLRYLVQRGELLGHRLLTIHNLHHVLELVRQARRAILGGSYEEFVAGRNQAPPV